MANPDKELFVQGDGYYLLNNTDITTGLKNRLVIIVC